MQRDRLQRLEVEIRRSRPRELAEQCDKHRTLQHHQLLCLSTAADPVGVVQSVGRSLCMHRQNTRLSHDELCGRIEEHLPNAVRRNSLSQHRDYHGTGLFLRYPIELRAQFCPCRRIIAPLLKERRDLAQPRLDLPPWSIRLKIVSGRIWTRIAVLQL